MPPARGASPSTHECAGATGLLCRGLCWYFPTQGHPPQLGEPREAGAGAVLPATALVAEGEQAQPASDY
jgi:hypothetical protein